MSGERTAASAARTVGSGAARVLRAWRVLPHERRLAAGAALGLFVTLFLPWYQETVVSTNSPKPVGTSVTGWGAFSFVEAAVLLVALGVLTLLIQRAEGRAFHLPGGDGWVIMLAGGWTCVLVIWRIFDKQGTTSPAHSAKTVVALGSSGIEWGIFVALAVAGFLTYTGSLIRSAHTPEPALPGDAEGRADDVAAGPAAPASRAEPEDATRRARRPAPARPPDAARPPDPTKRPDPARPPDSGSASDRRTGWLTARPEGWVEDPDAARHEPTSSWSYADDYEHEPADDYEEEPAPPPPSEDETRQQARASEPPEDTPDAAEPPTARITRRKRPPDEQLTIRLDQDPDA